MRDPKRIDKVLAKVREVWKTYPDLRLLQLLSNALPQGIQNGFYIEDEDLLKRMEITYDSSEALYFPGKKKRRKT